MNRLQRQIAILTVVALSSGCSIYKSGARKNLESLGPPPGSIKTSSVQLLVLDPNQISIPNEQSLSVCKLSTPEDHVCSQKLICLEAPENELSNFPQAASEIDSNLLVDENNTQKVFNQALLCQLKQ